MSKYDRTGKSSNKTFYILLGVIAFLLVFDVILKSVDENNNTTKLADGFTIEAYDVTLDVGLDNKINVTEKITTNFTSCNKHGIYKFTPLWLQYTGKDGKTIKRKSNVLNYRSMGDSYTIDTVKRKARIKIGSEYVTVGCGDKTYTIAYTYDMGKDPFKNFDELIFHAFGDYWGTEIKSASIRVNMPKSIEGYNVNFFTDKYRKNNITELVNYTISGNTLYATLNSEYTNQKQLEKQKCYEEYEEKYKIDGSLFCKNVGTTYHNEYQLMTALTVDIELPDGYFVGGSWNYGWGSFIISIIIILLTGWTIYKWVKFGKDFEKKAKTVEFYPPDDLNAAQVGYIFNKKQASKKLVISLIVQLASKGYIKIDELKDKKKNIQITKVASNDSNLKGMELIVYKKLFENKDVIVISEHKTLYEAFDAVEYELNSTLKDKVHDSEATKQIKGSIIRNIIILLLSIFSYKYVEDLDPSWSILYTLSFICIFINLFFTIFMQRKTEYGELITAKIKGFRHFLITAEKPRLEALVAENPNYFYDILPYTYALNISKKWINKFENIPIPKLDMGSFDFSSDSSYYHLFSNVYYPKPVYTSSSNSSNSRGCSSCGGGCSSCGGGCSSCGGGGSW